MNRIVFYKYTAVLVMLSLPGLSSADHRKGIHPQRLKTAIQRSANYLSNACDADGKFVYRINLNPKTTIAPRYNILRHAGSMYSLAMNLNAYPDEIVQAALIRAGHFLKNRAIRPLPDQPDMLAVWSDPQLNLRSEPLQAKLGGTGLGLVALLSVEKIRPGETSLGDLRKLGNFLRYMQKADGSFYSKYIPAEGGRSDRWKSLYYPGEAALGLLMLYELDPAPIWLNAAADAIAYLAGIRANKAKVAADHWSLLATAKLLPLYDRCHQPLPRNAIQAHAAQICKRILNQAEQIPKNYSAYGCFTGDGRTTPTATRIEGLLATLAFLPPERNELRKRIADSINKGMYFLLNAQVSKGKYAGAIPRGVHTLPQDHPRFTESFNRRVTEVRIDYVQHTLSAMIQYQQIFFGDVRPKASFTEPGLKSKAM